MTIVDARATAQWGSTVADDRADKGDADDSILNKMMIDIYYVPYAARDFLG
jgi:hypothetical protein